MKKLFEINSEIDRAACSREFAEHGWAQVRDVLTPETAAEVRLLLQHGTRWNMAIMSENGGSAGPKSHATTDVEQINQAAASAHAMSARGDYAFRYAHYPIVDALNQQWDPGGAHEILLEHLNTEEFLDLAREVTGIPALIRADAQATLFAANHYLGRHIDSHVAEGWRIAYVLNLAPEDWHPDWGGYLMFLDDDGDVIGGFRPRFNALNLFQVPRSHLVSYVPPFAPVGRFAITGWLSDR